MRQLCDGEHFRWRMPLRIPVDEDDEPLNKFSSRLELYYAQLERSISPVSGRIAGVTA